MKTDAVLCCLIRPTAHKRGEEKVITECGMTNRRAEETPGDKLPNTAAPCTTILEHVIPWDSACKSIGGQLTSMQKFM
jgi:hypothetical protein